MHEVDFNQLKIENSQYLEKIDERNQELLKLKMTAGSTLQVSVHFISKFTLYKHSKKLFQLLVGLKSFFYYRYCFEILQASTRISINIITCIANVTF